MSRPGGTPVQTQVAEWCAAQVGHAYVFGGAPGPDFTGPCDCSSFCNYAWGHVGQESIPGFPNGTYDGTSHGPSTLTWLDAQGTIVGSVNRSEVQAGDLAVWPTHMGMILSPTQMVSAQNPASGVQISGIDGFIPGETLTCLRLTVVGPGGISLPIPVLGSDGRIQAIARDIARDAVRLVGVQMMVRTIGKPGWRP